MKVKQEKIPIDEKLSIGNAIVEAIQNGMPGIEHMIMEEVESVTKSLKEKYPQYEDETQALEDLACDLASDIHYAAEQELPSLSDLNIVEEDVFGEDELPYLLEDEEIEEEEEVGEDDESEYRED